MNTEDNSRPSAIELPAMGMFVLKNARYLQIVRFQDQEVPFALHPSGQLPLTDKWLQKMSVRCRRFIARFDSQVETIGENVRKLCREYDLYENVDIPWNDRELVRI